jgi:hypothetical protein
MNNNEKERSEMVIFEMSRVESESTAKFERKN